MNADSGLGGVPLSGRAWQDQLYAEPVGQTAKPLAHNADSGRVIRRGDIFIGWPERRLAERHWIEVRRVARDHSWADIAVKTWAVAWTKRQPTPDGRFAFPHVEFDWSYSFFDLQEQDHIAMLAEERVSRNGRSGA